MAWQDVPKFHAELSKAAWLFYNRRHSPTGKWFLPLAGQSPGCKRVVSYADVEYFNNTRKASRVAHTQRIIPYPSMEQAAHALQRLLVATG